MNGRKKPIPRHALPRPLPCTQVSLFSIPLHPSPYAEFHSSLPPLPTLPLLHPSLPLPLHVTSSLLFSSTRPCHHLHFIATLQPHANPYSAPLPLSLQFPASPVPPLPQSTTAFPLAPPYNPLPISTPPRASPPSVLCQSSSYFLSPTFQFHSYNKIYNQASSLSTSDLMLMKDCPPQGLPLKPLTLLTSSSS